MYAIVCSDRPDSAASRDAHRAAHLEFLNKHSKQIVFGGPLKATPEGASTGALIVVDCATREEAQALVSYCRYPPKGQRSNGPIRAAMYGVAGTYQQTANDEIHVIPMIETRQAVENIDEILDVTGIDAIYVGPSDLSISHGYPPGGDKPDEWMMAALKKVLDACKRHKVQPGIHCGAASYAKKMIEMGFTFVTVGGDNRFMTLGGQAAVAEMKDAPKPGASSSPY